MGFWSRIAGRALARLEDARSLKRPPGPPESDPAFAAAVTALGAKLARADGRADPIEFDAFAEVFQPDARSAPGVRRLYNLARQTSAGYEAYARRLAKRYRASPQVLEDVIEGLCHIAASDGVATEAERDYLRTVADLFGLHPLTYRRIEATWFGLAQDDPYAVLGLSPDAPVPALREARRRLLLQAHPDTVRARGLPEEYVEVFTARAAAINAAFDAAMRDRLDPAEVAEPA
ncbi:MAG TPA: TerB family tellurite resistance protein [Caulobacteraceae bacterium]